MDKPCEYCGGTGKQTCEECNGTGERWPFSELNSSSHFISSKVRFCTRCKGRGKIVCSFCNGTGKQSLKS